MAVDQTRQHCLVAQVDDACSDGQLRLHLLRAAHRKNAPAFNENRLLGPVLTGADVQNPAGLDHQRRRLCLHNQAG